MKHTSCIKTKTFNKSFMWSENELKCTEENDDSCTFRIKEDNEYIGTTNSIFLQQQLQKAQEFLQLLPKEKCDFSVKGGKHPSYVCKFPSIDPYKIKDDIYDFLKSNIEHFFTVDSLEIYHNKIDSTTTNDQGLHVNYILDYWSIMVGIVLKDKTTQDKQTIYDFAYISSKFQLKDFLNRIHTNCQNALNPIKIKKGIYDVILDNSITQYLIKNIFSMMKGSSIFNKTSYIKVGDQVLPEYVSIIENPHGFFPIHVDCDGNITKKKYIIKNGKVNSFILNNKYASKLKMEPTGNSFDFSESVSNIEFENLKSFDQSIKNFNGLYIQDILGVSFNSVNGDFSCSIKGFVLQNGKKTQSFLDGTMYFNIFDVCNKMDLLDNLPIEGSPVNCPSMIIRQLTIGGL